MKILGQGTTRLKPRSMVTAGCWFKIGNAWEWWEETFKAEDSGKAKIIVPQHVWDSRGIPCSWGEEPKDSKSSGITIEWRQEDEVDYWVT